MVSSPSLGTGWKVVCRNLYTRPVEYLPILSLIHPLIPISEILWFSTSFPYLSPLDEKGWLLPHRLWDHTPKVIEIVLIPLGREPWQLLRLQEALRGSWHLAWTLRAAWRAAKECGRVGRGASWVMACGSQRARVPRVWVSLRPGGAGTAMLFVPERTRWLI